MKARRYQALGPLLSGGEGSRAFLGLEISGDQVRPVAMIWVPEEIYGDPTLAEKVRRETERAAALHHPNILRVLAIAETEGFMARVVEFANGESLRRTLEVGGALPPGLAARVVAEAAEGVHHAHTVGPQAPWVHGDLRPETLFLTYSGAAKVSGYGALYVAPKEMAGKRVVGRRVYSAPEQLLGGRDAANVQTDVFLLGLVLWEALTGKAPFADAPDPDRAALDRDLDLSAIPEPLRPVIATATAKKAYGRYPTALALCEAIEAAVGPFPPEGAVSGWLDQVFQDDASRAARSKLIETSIAELQKKLGRPLSIPPTPPPLPGAKRTRAKAAQPAQPAEALPAPVAPVAAPPPLPPGASAAPAMVPSAAAAPLASAPVPPPVAPPAVPAAAAHAAVAPGPRAPLPPPAAPARAPAPPAPAVHARSANASGAPAPAASSKPEPAAPRGPERSGRRSSAPALVGAVLIAASAAIVTWGWRQSRSADVAPAPLPPIPAPVASRPAEPAEIEVAPIEAPKQAGGRAQAPAQREPRAAQAPRFASASSDAPAAAVQAVAVKAQPAAASANASSPMLAVEVVPPVTVFVDGKSAGVSPISIPTKAGAHQLRLADKALGIDLRRSVNVARQGTTRAEITVGKAAVFVEGPAGSTVYVDGKSVATLPLSADIEVYEGQHQLRVDMGGTNWKQQFTLGDGDRMRFQVAVETRELEEE